MLYNLKGTLINLIPGNVNPPGNTDALHVRFLHSAGLTSILNVHTQTTLTDSCDSITRKSIYLTSLYILKRFLLVLAYYHIRQPNCPPVLQTSLEQLLSLLPPPTTSSADPANLMGPEQRIGNLLIQHMQTYPIPKHSFLQYNHLIELIRLIWCLAGHHRQSSFEQKLKTSFEEIHQTFKENHGQVNEDFYEDTDESQLACREGLELLCLAIALVPSSVEQLLEETFFGAFLIDLVSLLSLSHHSSNGVRSSLLLDLSLCSRTQCRSVEISHRSTMSTDQ